MKSPGKAGRALPTHEEKHIQVGFSPLVLDLHNSGIFQTNPEVPTSRHFPTHPESQLEKNIFHLEKHPWCSFSWEGKKILPALLGGICESRWEWWNPGWISQAVASGSEQKRFPVSQGNSDPIPEEFLVWVEAGAGSSWRKGWQSWERWRGFFLPPLSGALWQWIRGIGAGFHWILGKLPPKPPLPGFSARPDGDETAAAFWLIPISWKFSLDFGKSGPFQTRDNSGLESRSVLCALCEFCQLPGDVPASFQGFFGVFLSSPSS